jgi:hypothetical protein
MYGLTFILCFFLGPMHNHQCYWLPPLRPWQGDGRIYQMAIQSIHATGWLRWYQRNIHARCCKSYTTISVSLNFLTYSHWAVCLFCLFKSIGLLPILFLFVFFFIPVIRVSPGTKKIIHSSFPLEFCIRPTVYVNRVLSSWPNFNV